MSRVSYNALMRLIATNPDVNLESTFAKNISESLKIKEITLIDVYECFIFKKIDFKIQNEDSIKWKFVSVIGFVLLQIADEKRSDPELLISVNLQKCIKGSLEFIVTLGLLPVLLPGVGVPIELRSEYGIHITNEKLSVVATYDRLKSMCNLFTELCNCDDIKTIIYSNFIKDYLAALLQLSYVPVIKPGSSNKNKDFTMTDEFWNIIQNDKKIYKSELDGVISNCFRPLLIKELLILQRDRLPPIPLFIKRALSDELSKILLSDDGLISVMRCFLDYDIDTGEKWKHIDLITRLISVKHGSNNIDEYLNIICNQMRNIILNSDAIKENEKYISICAYCITNLYEKYPENVIIQELINSILNPFLDVRYDDAINGTLILSFSEVYTSIKILDLCFNIPKLCLKADFLTPIIYKIFCLRIHSKSLKQELDNLLINNFSSRKCSAEIWFNALILKKQCQEISVDNNIIYDNFEEQTQMKYYADNGNISVEDSVNCMLEIIEEHVNVKELSNAFFLFCLKTATSYKQNGTNKDLLIHEDETYDLIDKDSENLLILIKALQKLISMHTIIESLNNDPKIIFDFITTLLTQYREDLRKNTVSTNTDCVVIGLTLFAVLLSQRSNRDLLKIKLKSVLSDIKEINHKSPRDDIKMLCNEIDMMMMDTMSGTKSNTEFEKAVQDICDPLLAVRAHGLMHLTKLIEKKDFETISKKLYVQCIFEENLKNDDSYIYLAAINGLAAIANYSAEDVLEVLTREFLNCKKELVTSEEKNETSEIRMKIGEVLVKVTKNLGEIASVHKGILLNTFLSGCKDPDDLVRASSLSNLAEVCRVLSYRLGSVLYEMLNCFNSILETDPSPECRRASVLVVGSLLKGLGKDALLFLKESLLPIYRTLKRLYRDESEDSIVRLHAQIALEELNDIVKDLLFAPLKMEKEIFLLNKPSI